MNHESTSKTNPFSMGATAFRSPKRISITVPYGAYRRLLDRSDQEGRSLSNLAAFLLETVLSDHQQSNRSLL